MMKCVSFLFTHTLPSPLRTLGVAYNPAKGTFYLTGKKWPVLFEVELVKVEDPSSEQLQDVRKRFIWPAKSNPFG